MEVTTIPERKIHLQDDRRILGREYAEIHKFMDRPSKYMGRRHRRVRHDLGTVLLILFATGDPRAAVSALMHIAHDKRGK